MKSITKISLAVVAAAVLGSLSARADDQQLANRLAIQRAPAASDTSVAIFANGQGLGGNTAQLNDLNNQGPQPVLRFDGHGQQSLVYR
jgi:hypothetical protein